MKPWYSLTVYTDSTFPLLSFSFAHDPRTVTLARTHVYMETYKEKPIHKIRSSIRSHGHTQSTDKYLADTVNTTPHAHSSHATPAVSGSHPHGHSLARHPPPALARVRRPRLPAGTKSSRLRARGFPRTHHRARRPRAQSRSSTPLKCHSGRGLRYRRHQGPRRLWLGQHQPWAVSRRTTVPRRPRGPPRGDWPASLRIMGITNRGV